MAAYCAKSDLVERYGAAELGQLTDETAGQSVDDSEVEKNCEEATSLIDSFVSARYATPLLPVPTIVRKWACDIALRFLWKDRGPSEAVQKLYDEALAALRDIARGLAQLPGATGTLPTGSGSSIAVVASTQVFSDAQLALMPASADVANWRTMTP